MGPLFGAWGWYKVSYLWENMKLWMFSDFNIQIGNFRTQNHSNHNLDNLVNRDHWSNYSCNFTNYNSLSTHRLYQRAVSTKELVVQAWKDPFLARASILSPEPAWSKFWIVRLRNWKNSSLWLLAKDPNFDWKCWQQQTKRERQRIERSRKS